MNLRIVALALFAACRGSSPRIEIEPAPPAFGVAYERLLPTSDRNETPLFGGDGWITVGSTRWQPDGKRAATATVPREAVATRLLSPRGAAFVGVEGGFFVVRAVRRLQTVLARVALAAEDDHHACWVDDFHIAWRDHAGTFATLDIVRGTIEHMRAPAGSIAACDPRGGYAALATERRIQIIDLATGAPRGAVTTATPTELVALGGNGCELATYSRRIISVYRCTNDRWYLPTFVRALSTMARPPRKLQFSPDGETLALVGESLVVMRAGAVEVPPPALPTLAELPSGFVTRRVVVPEYDDWEYAQLAMPSGLSQLPVVLINARRKDDLAVVRAVAMPHAAVSVAAPTSDADDSTIRAYARGVMPELFDSWRLEQDSDELEIRVGRREGKPWFEAREFWRDGCDWYDGYTQVVVDRDLLFVTRALVLPHASTNRWLQTFFDLPFQQRTRLARRRGPESGPC